jgi:translation initiation factor 2B subunit (eIF-2B alpha/beta/delta family)
MNKSVTNLYRDCLRTIEHAAGDSVKSRTMKQLVARQFRQSKHVKDTIQLERLRKNAMSGLANYLSMQTVSSMPNRPSDASIKNATRAPLNEDQKRQLLKQAMQLKQQRLQKIQQKILQSEQQEADHRTSGEQEAVIEQEIVHAHNATKSQSSQDKQ